MDMKVGPVVGQIYAAIGTRFEILAVSGSWTFYKDLQTGFCYSREWKWLHPPTLVIPKQVRWVNIYKEYSNGGPSVTYGHKTKENALKSRSSNCVATVRIEYQEDEGLSND